MRELFEKHFSRLDLRRYESPPFNYIDIVSQLQWNAFLVGYRYGLNVENDECVLCAKLIEDAHSDQLIHEVSNALMSRNQNRNQNEYET